jgi:hypothetical protein
VGPSRYDHPKVARTWGFSSIGLPLPRELEYLMGGGLWAAYTQNVLVSTVNLMVKPNGLLVLVSSTHYCAYTSSLSTRSSSSALQGSLILRKVSRLYAFSAYPDRTSLLSCATGVTTESQEVRPARSSRTRARPSQTSYAHSR